MRRKLLTVLGATAMLVAVTPAARADAFLSLQNGATTLTCNNSTAAGVGTCTALGFTTSLGSNTISFSGAIGGYFATNITLAGNSPGSPTLAFGTDTKTAIQNVSAGSTSLLVNFAENNYTLPAGSTLLLSASQSATFTSAAAGSSQTFTGFGNIANTLATVGIAEATPSCVNPSVSPPANACSSVGTPTTFTRAGAFSLAGLQVVTLNEGGIASFTATVDATPITTPEPASMVLLATGLIGIAGQMRGRRRNG